MKTAVEIARDVRAKKITVRSVVEESLAAIDARESEIHAFNLVLRDEALARADELDRRIAAGETLGRLAGVPIAIKDNMATRGIPTTCSSKILAGWKPPYDATVITRLLAEDAVIIGKTNLDEFAMGTSTENSAFGPTMNPVDPTRIPGGSSGGSAAAVGAGFVPVALGSDTGGSIRQPAAVCGVVGVKPTYGAVSRYGLVAFASSLDQIGPLATTVEDAALVLEVIAGHDASDSTSIDAPAPSVSTSLNQGIEGLRVGIIGELMKDIEPGVDVRMRLAVETLERMGAKVGDAMVPAAVYGVTSYYIIAPAEASSNLARFDGVRFGLRVDGEDVNDMYRKTRAEGFGPEVKRRIMLGTYSLSSGYYDAYYGKAQRVRTLIQRDFAAAFEQYDILISPTSPMTAWKLGAVTDPLQLYMADICTIPANLAGIPAMSVPFGTGANNMPVGVQVIAPALGEETMFRAARALELAENAQ